jgi:hypothetical protein
MAIAQRGETYRLMERYEEALKDLTMLELDPNTIGRSHSEVKLTA